MLTAREGNIRKRLATFERNLKRAEALGGVDVGGEALKGAPSIDVDLRRAEIVFTVGAIDELCKGLFFEVLLGYLLGDVKLIDPPRAPIPAVVARLFLEAEMSEAIVQPQMEAIAVAQLYKHIERDNYQNYEAIAKRFSECGLGKLKAAFPDNRERTAFNESLDCLAGIRHNAVHRLGLVEQFVWTSDDSDVVTAVSLEISRHRSNLLVGGRRMGDRVVDCITPV